MGDVDRKENAEGALGSRSLAERLASVEAPASREEAVEVVLCAMDDEERSVFSRLRPRDLVDNPACQGIEQAVEAWSQRPGFLESCGVSGGRAAAGTIVGAIRRRLRTSREPDRAGAPEDPGARVSLARKHAASGATADAETAYLDALRVDPDFGPAWVGLADLYRQTQDLAKCERACEETVRINPRDVDALMALGQIRAEQGNRAGVADVYKSLKALSPSVAEVFFKRFIAP